jgi:parallel beta-helix repeat protein
VSITENSIFDNGGIGIDLAAGTSTSGDGFTVNDANDIDSGGNDLLNFPVITSAGEGGGTITVNFNLDLPAGDYRIEFFTNPSGADPSTYGEGEIFASFVNINHTGSGTESFSHGFPGSVGDVITATTSECTDGPTCSTFGNTSEFCVAVTAVAGTTIDGQVFEDVNYGGGTGRDQATAAADAPTFTVERDNVTVELYGAAGNYLSSTTTAADGSYAFGGLPPAIYTVRVVNGTVGSTRTGSDGSEVAVQTYRIDGNGEPGGTGPSRVGGERPANEDAAANSGAQTLASLQGTDIDTDGVTEWTQSIVTVDASGGNVSGVDFGFNFDTIVNTNDAEQGSLRQFLLNANLLTDQASLDQDDALASLPAGYEHTVFMIPTSDPGFGPTIDGGIGNAFIINPASQLPIVTDGNTAIDGRTQTGFTGDTNGAVVEPPTGPVGTPTTGPEIIIDYQLLFIDAPGLQIQGANTVVDSIGMTAVGGTTNRASGIRFEGGTAGSIVRNSTSWENDSYGFRVTNTNNVMVTDNVGRTNGSSNHRTADGLIADSASNLTVVNNSFVGNIGDGIDRGGSNSLLQGNLLKGNGATVKGASGTDGSGARLRNGSDSSFIGNVITGNRDGGVRVSSTASGFLISQNQIYENTQLGINLEGGTEDAFGVTTNDSGDGDTGANELQNFPALSSAGSGGGVTIILGTFNSTPSTTFTVEFFSSVAADPSGSGEGEIYIGTDTISTDPGGNALISTTLPLAVTAGEVITATARDPSNNPRG